MSDPVTNAEIEDVLSSIRRLVSDEPLNAKTRKQPGEPANDSFLLTPALRVMDEPEGSTDPADRQSDETETQDTGSSPGNQAGEAGEDGGQDDEMWQSSGQDDETWQASGQDDVDLTEIAGPDLGASADDGPDTEDQEDHSEAAQTAASGAVGTEIEEHDVTPTLTLEQRIAELEAAIEQSPGEWEPDGSEEVLTDETTPIGLTDEAGELSGKSIAVGQDEAVDPDGLADVPPETVEALQPEAETPEATAGDEIDPFAEHPQPEQLVQAQAEAQSDDTAPAVSQASLAEEPVTGAELLHLSDPEAEAPEPQASQMTEQFGVDQPETLQEADQKEQPELDAAESSDTEDEAVAETLVAVKPEPELYEPEKHEMAQDDAPGEDDVWRDENDAEFEPEANSQEDLTEAGPALEPEAREVAPEPDRHDKVARNAGDPDQAETQDESTEYDDDATEPAFDLYADEALMDEEALREMVANLVRQELQGVLGERITRNVRRLVRREIQRALAVREFE